MDSSYLLSDSDLNEETDRVHSENKHEQKTDNESIKKVNKDVTEFKQDLEYTEDSLLIENPSMFIESKTDYYQDNISSAITSLTSGSTNPCMADCSKKNCEDSNSTIKNMINSKKPIYLIEDTVKKEDGKHDLVNSPELDLVNNIFCSGMLKKNFCKENLFKGHLNCETDISESDGFVLLGPSGITNSNGSSMSSDSSKEYSLPSTSNADNLLSLDNSKKNDDFLNSKSPKAHFSRIDMMDPFSDCDLSKGIDKVSSEHEDKANNESSENNNKDIIEFGQDNEYNLLDPSTHVDRKMTDHNEYDLLNRHPSMIVDRNTTDYYSDKISSSSSSLVSISVKSSSLNLIAKDYRMIDCTKIKCEDSNATIKNMIHSKKTMYSIDDTVKKEEVCSVSPKQDFMQKLLSGGTMAKKKIPKGKLYKGDINCETDGESDVLGSACPGPSNGSNASSDSSKENSVPSTSNAEKLLGLDKIRKKNDFAYFQQSYTPRIDDFEEESEDEQEAEDVWCTCISSHDEDEDNDDEDDPEDRLSRKRRGELSNSSAKKFCSEYPVPSTKSEDLIWSPTTASNIGQQLSPLNTVECPQGFTQWINRFMSWSRFEKTQAIEELINRCEAADVRHMMDVIEPLFQRDFISLLPKELALTVLGYLEPKDLLRAAQTCRYWRFLADDNLLWKEQCRRNGVVSYKKSLPRSLPHMSSPWKAAYMRQHLIENNWLHKSVENTKVLRGHDEHVITCLQFYGNKILSGSDDTTLKVWSATTGKCLRILVGHTGGVWSSQMVGDLVISGSTDRTLRVWNAKSGACLKVLTGHTSTVRCMHLHEDRVVSGSRDATLRIWSIPDGKCLRVLIGHLAAVRCVQFDGKLVVSGAYDYFVKVWNPDTGECLHTLAGHTNRVYSLQFDGVHVVSGSLDTSIRVWDVETGQLKYTLTGHQSLTSGMELNSNTLVSGNADSTVKVWDITNGQCRHTLAGPNKHQSAVTCLQTTNRFIITSSDDGTVKLWDLRSGEFIRNLVELSSGGSGGVVWRIRASETKLICAVGSRNGTEETKLLVLDFDIPGACKKCNE